MNTAVFIGGAFDMTKRVIHGRPRQVTFFEPTDPDAKAKYDIPEQNMDCLVLWYELITETPQGILIYEYGRREK